MTGPPLTRSKLSDSTFYRSSSPMWIYDQETLQFLEVNEAAISLYEYSQREFLRMTILYIRPAEDIPKLLRDSMRPDKRHESHAEHWRHATKCGNVIEFRGSSWEMFFK